MENTDREIEGRGKYSGLESTAIEGGEHFGFEATGGFVFSTTCNSTQKQKSPFMLRRGGDPVHLSSSPSPPYGAASSSTLQNLMLGSLYPFLSVLSSCLSFCVGQDVCVSWDSYLRITCFGRFSNMLGYFI